LNVQRGAMTYVGQRAHYLCNGAEVSGADIAQSGRNEGGKSQDADPHRLGHLWGIFTALANRSPFSNKWTGRSFPFCNEILQPLF
jgi:hypothetical protein